MPCGDLRHGGRPRVGGEAVRELDRGGTSARSGRYVGCSRAREQPSPSSVTRHVR